MELRELEAKLKAGYMNKERAAQLAEKEVIKKQEEVKHLTKNNVEDSYIYIGLLSVELFKADEAT